MKPLPAFVLAAMIGTAVFLILPRRHAIIGIDEKLQNHVCLAAWHIGILCHSRGIDHADWQRISEVMSTNALAGLKAAEQWADEHAPK